MLQSQLFTKTKREFPKDEEAVNAKLLIRAGFVDKLTAGVYTLLPLGFRVYKKIENIIREEMKALGAQEILMPALQPKSNWETTGRWNTLDSLIKFSTFYTKNEYALGPTHEEIVSPLAKKFIFSYKDLPTAVFQIQTKFRDEKRAKSGLLRGREFSMKDLYSFHVDEKDLDDYYEKAKSAYEKIFKKAGIGNFTYLTFASGGTFSKHSHEFQMLAESGEDTIYICEKCRVAVNKEIINEPFDTAQGKQIGVCPSCGNKNLEEKNAIEVGNIFKLRTKYSAPFDLKYRDNGGHEHDVEMGCYGLGLTRLLAATVEAFHDEKGIIWPETTAPFNAHLIELEKGMAKKICANLQKSGVEVLYDDRDTSVGEKFADADLIGIPYRLVVSKKTGEKIEVKKRNGEKVELVSEKELLKLLKNI